jgi:hypothetical protein
VYPLTGFEFIAFSEAFADGGWLPEWLLATPASATRFPWSGARTQRVPALQRCPILRPGCLYYAFETLLKRQVFQLAQDGFHRLLTIDKLRACVALLPRFGARIIVGLHLGVNLCE